ncbi:MAG: hypothetical protein AB1489_43130 [Acidobacteriota bacterium]
MKPTLIFVYNGDSGLFNTLSHVAHKIFSPQTYPCNLCTIINSPLGMRKEWKQFLKELDTPYEFLHTDELKNHYGIEDIPLPAIFSKGIKSLEILIDAKSINNCQTIADLKALILKRISKF